MLNNSQKKANRLSDWRIYHNSDVHIGDRIKQARRALKLSQAELARRAGVSQATISDLERKKSTTLQGAHLFALSYALGLKVEWFSEKLNPAANEEELAGQAEVLAIFSKLHGEDRLAWLRHGRLLIEAGTSPRTRPLKDLFAKPIYTAASPVKPKRTPVKVLKRAK
jgi:transcriptional regulator with XRE-family HTH domain